MRDRIDDILVLTGLAIAAAGIYVWWGNGPGIVAAGAVLVVAGVFQGMSRARS